MGTCRGESVEIGAHVNLAHLSHGRRKDVDFIFNQTRTATHTTYSTYRNTYAKGRRITHSERQQTNKLTPHARHSRSEWREGAAAAAAARRRGRGSRGPPRLLVLQEVMLEQHQPQPRRASARSHARGGRSGSAQSRQPAAAEAPDTHTRGGQLGLGQSGRHDYGCGAGTRARWRLTSVVGCHRVDQESTGAARAPIAPRHIFAGVHIVGGSRMRRPRQLYLRHAALFA